MPRSLVPSASRGRLAARVTGLVTGLVAALVAATLTTPAPSTAAVVAVAASARTAASMDFAPKTFVGGMRLTFTGNIGVRGRRAIRLQVHMNRPGDRWQTIDGFRRTTNRDGSFRFHYVAPSMRDKSLRVRGEGGYVTPSRLFNARSQDVVLETAAGEPLQSAVVGQPFDVRVDTTPTVEGRSDLPGPVLAGRALTLQRRVIDPTQPLGYSSPWRTVATGVVTDAQGVGLFRDVAVAQLGTVVYRVRQERWTRNGDDVGWFASFPTPVTVHGLHQRPPSVDLRSATLSGSTGTSTGSGGSTTAGTAYGWAPALWDFGWAAGESLSTPPHRGSDPVGWWLDASDGTGRAVQHNGQLMLDSQRELRRWAASRGTTMVTLQDNPMRLGRWEVRLRADTDDQGFVPGRTRIELVPANPAHYACGARTITVAEVAPGSGAVTIGARSPSGRTWSRTLPGLAPDNVNHAWALEVGRSHLTWFREGRAIGTVPTSAAVPDVPMTLRLSIVGRGDDLVDKTQTYYDWMRAYPLGRGTEVRSGAALAESSSAPGC